MTSVSQPSYLLAPNWTFTLDGPLALGNIIGDPMLPHRSLSKVADDAAHVAPTVKSVDSDWHLEVDRLRSYNVKLWAEILQVASLNASHYQKKVAKITFDMSELHTVYHKDNPYDIPGLVERLREPRVRRILTTRKFGRRGAVYFVSGIKIAKGFIVKRHASRETQSGLGMKVEVAPEASVGADFGVGAHTGRTESSSAKNDIIFAYELLRIRLKGKGDTEEVEIDEFERYKAKLLGDSETSAEENEGDITEDNLDLTEPSLEDIYGTRKGLTVQPDDDQYSWLELEQYHS